VAKKIGILTYFWADNPGTFLQAYATLYAYRKRFPEHRVELVDVRYRRNLFRPNRRDTSLKCLVTHWHYHGLLKRCRRQHLAMSPRGIVTQDYEAAAAYVEAQRYDLVVVGADEILQMLPKYLARGQPPIYWLPPSLACRKVVCAGSAGTTLYENLSEPMRQRLAESIHAYDLVGVRDDVAYTLMEQLGLKGDPRLQRVPDSTFAWPIDPQPAAEAVKRFGLDVARPTVGINAPVNEANVLRLLDHYRSRGYQLVSLAAPSPADYWLWFISPFEWAGIYRYFQFTLTDRFHGSAFSLRSGRLPIGLDFNTQYTAAGLSKKHSLLKEFGLAETAHINVDRVKDFDELLARCEAAIAAFDAGKALDTAVQLGRKYEAFLDQVAGLL
jgi:hypothetical protein